jgi:hypothetical protein
MPTVVPKVQRIDDNTIVATRSSPPYFKTRLSYQNDQDFLREYTVIWESLNIDARDSGFTNQELDAIREEIALRLLKLRDLGTIRSESLADPGYVNGSVERRLVVVEAAEKKFKPKSAEFYRAISRLLNLDPSQAIDLYSAILEQRYW